MHNFPRPSQDRLYADREPVDQTCPACGSATAVARYRVLTEGGWWDAVKCVDGLYTIDRTRAPRLGSFSPMVSVATFATRADSVETKGENNVRS